MTPGWRSSWRRLLALYAIYLQPWHIPIKYLVPGTIFLILFQIIPVVFTFAHGVHQLR